MEVNADIVNLDSPITDRKREEFKDCLIESIEEFVADGIMLMEHFYDQDSTLKRQLRITKMRGTNHSRKTHNYKISAEGLNIEL